MRGLDSYQIGFLAAAAIFIAFTARHGWRQGIAKQLMNILALAAAYLIGYFGGGNLAAILHRFVDMPERVLAVVSAVGLGFVVYCCIRLIGVIAMTKTAEQKPGLTRLSYGVAGAVCGAFYGGVIVWIAVLAVRLLGSVAETQLAKDYYPAPSAIKGERVAAATPAPALRPIEPSPVVKTLAHMKESLEQGPTGAVVQQVDPIPGTLYGTLRKLGIMVSDEKSIDRFLSYPGVKPLLAHPKIAALQNDQDITRDLINHNYFALIGNRHIVAAANDAEIAQLMQKFEFEKALDYAIRRPEQDTAQNRGAPKAAQ